MDATRSEIYAALRREACRAPQVPHMFSIVERRAARVRAKRRGLAAASLGALAVIMIVSVSGRGGTERGSRPPVGGSGASAPAAAMVMTWPEAGDGASYDWVDLDGVRRSVEAQMPPPFTTDEMPKVLWSGQTDAGPAVVVAVRSGNRTAVGAVVQVLGASIARGVHEVGETDAEVSVLVDLPLGAGAVDNAIVIASPDRSWKLQVQRTGAPTWTEVLLHDGRSGVASIGRIGNADPPQLKLTAGRITLQATIGLEEAASRR